jgi:putative ABC transport system substrate-binding protein
MLLRAIEESASSLAVSVRVAPVHDEAEIRAAMVTLSQEERGDPLTLPDSFTIVNRAFIIASAAQTHLPAVYWSRALAADGGLMSYGADNPDLFRRSAVYIDRILKGAKPRDLAVQNLTKFQLVVSKPRKRSGSLFRPQSWCALTS